MHSFLRIRLICYACYKDNVNSVLTGESQVDFAMVVKSFLCLALFFTYPGMD